MFLWKSIVNHSCLGSAFVNPVGQKSFYSLHICVSYKFLGVTCLTSIKFGLTLICLWMVRVGPNMGCMSDTNNCYSFVICILELEIMQRHCCVQHSQKANKIKVSSQNTIEVQTKPVESPFSALLPFPDWGLWKQYEIRSSLSLNTATKNNHIFLILD